MTAYIFSIGTFANYNSIVALSLSFWLSLFIGKVRSTIEDIIICSIWDMERLARKDEVFAPHNNRAEQPVNIQIMMTTTKFKFEEMRDQMFKEVSKLPRLRSRLVQFMGKFFFLRMDGAEWLQKRDKVFVRIDSIHTHEETESFLAEQTKLIMDLDNTACYRIYLVPDYSETESKIICVANHMLGDGVSGMGLLAFLQPSKDFSCFGKMAPSPWYVQLAQSLIAPFTVPLIFRKYRSLKPVTNCIQQVEVPSLERCVKVLDTVSLADVKNVTKHQGVTFNIIIYALLSQTLAEYFRRRGDTKTSDITASTAFSLRPFP